MWTSTGFVASLLSATLLGQRATATVQLPVVRTVGVGTSVSVPDSGRGLVASDKRVVGHAAGRARMRQGAGDSLCVGVTIHDIDEVEQRNAWRVAYRLFERGRVADAIDRFEELAAQADSASAREAAKRELAALAEIGGAAFDRALALAESDESIEGARLVDKVLADFGKLIAAPDRLAAQKQLRQRPALAEARDGNAAMELYQKGKQNQEKGKINVAKLFYQQAALKRGTKAADLAVAELAAMGAPMPRERASGRTRRNEAAATTQTNPAQRWLDLARLYRDVDPNRAKDFYRKALSELPKDGPLTTAIVQEAAFE